MALNHGYVESAFSFEPMHYPPLMEYIALPRNEYGSQQWDPHCSDDYL